MSMNSWTFWKDCFKKINKFVSCCSKLTSFSQLDSFILNWPENEQIQALFSIEFLFCNYPNIIRCYSSDANLSPFLNFRALLFGWSCCQRSREDSKIARGFRLNCHLLSYVCSSLTNEKSVYDFKHLQWQYYIVSKKLAMIKKCFDCIEFPTCTVSGISSFRN